MKPSAASKNQVRRGSSEAELDLTNSTEASSATGAVKHVDGHHHNGQTAAYVTPILPLDPSVQSDGGSRPLLRPSTATVSVVIPVRNEADNLPHVLPRIPEWVDELIIVDGHSEDDTVAVAKSLCPRARVISQAGVGKGDAIACGIREVTSDITVLLDGDGSTDPQEIPRFVAALANGYDVAKGTRFVTGGGSDDITPLRRLGNRILTSIVNRGFGVRYSDLCYGYNAFWTRCVPPAITDCPGFEIETLMNIRIAVNNRRVVEVPSFERSRRAGRSNLSTRRDGWRVLRTIAAEWIRPR